jgi:hypothetical protein
MDNSYAHIPSTVWASVDNQNRVVGGDLASWAILASAMTWPITAGGFRWLIPDEYRIQRSDTGAWSDVFPCAGSPMPQVMRIDPTHPTAPFRGQVTIWKGGEQVAATY